MPNLREYFDLVAIWESDYGQEYGWLIKKDGELIAKLSDCIGIEMFWASYKIGILTSDNGLIEKLRDPSFWNNLPIGEFIIENAIINYKIDYFLCNLDQQNERLDVHSLIVPARYPTFCDYLLTRILNIFYKKNSPTHHNKKNMYCNWFTDKYRAKTKYAEREANYANYLEHTNR